MIRAVTVAKGWILVDVPDTATIEEILAAAGYVRRPDDGVITELDADPVPNRTIDTEQFIILLRDIPQLPEVEDGSVPGDQVKEPGGLPESAETVVVGGGVKHEANEPVGSTEAVAGVPGGVEEAAGAEPGVNDPVPRAGETVGVGGDRESN